MLSTGQAFAELGLSPNATDTEVKAAWRRLVSLWHPDRNASATAVEKIQRINQAYRLILRGARNLDRDAPDDANDNARAAPEPAPAPPAHAGGPRQTIDRTVSLTLEEATAGCTRVLQGELIDICAACAGSGEQVPVPACAACAGSGMQRQRSWYGWMTALTTCATCDGSGTLAAACSACHGVGQLALGKYRIAVRIPPGARHGDLLHVDASRAAGQAAKAAVDLEIHIEVAPHALFALADDGTVRSEVPVDGFVWVANRTVQVPTLDGLRTLALSRERLSYVLKGQGFPSKRRGPRADHLIEIRPVFPAAFSTDQNILLDQLIATRWNAADSAFDARLDAWEAAVRDWERSRAGRAGEA